MNLAVFLTRGMSLAKWAKGGVLGRELALYERLALEGVSTTFVSWGGRDEARHLKDRPKLAVAANVLGLSREWYERLLPLLHARVFRRAHIIKTNQMDGADVALRCSRVWRTPLLARCGFMWSEFRRLQGLEDEASRAAGIEARVYAQAAGGVVTTRQMLDYLVQRHGVREDKLRVIPNYVPEAFFAENRGPGRGKPVILALGRFSGQKNLVALVRACQGLDATLRLIGQGDLKDDLAALAGELGVDVEMPGKIPHELLPGEIAAADVFAQVSLYEGHPKTLLEAMACGAAIVASDGPGVGGVVEHGRTALVCGTDSASIHDGLKRLLQDPDLRSRLGREARRQARAEFALGVVAEKELRVYTDILERKK